MIFSQMRRPPQREDRLSRTDSNNGLILRNGFVRVCDTCLRCQGFGVALHYPRVTLHDRPCKNSYWGWYTHVLSSQDVWWEDTTPRHYLLMEMVMFDYHFYLLPQSRLPTTGSRQDNSMDSPISWTCSGRASECGRSGSGLLCFSSLALSQFVFRHFDARKNGKSNVNKIVMKNEPLVGSNIFFTNTNMHKNKV